MYIIFSQIGEDTVTVYAKTKSWKVADGVVTDLINNFDVANSNKFHGAVVSYYYRYIPDVPVSNDRDAITKRIVKHVKAENHKYPHYERQSDVHSYDGNFD